MATCASNLGQIGKALHLYAQDHDDRIPPVVTYTVTKQLVEDGPFVQISGDSRRWVQLINAYAKSEEIFFCPADPLARTSVERDVKYLFALNSSEFTSYETVTLTGDFFDERGVLQMSLSAVPGDRVYAGDFMFESTGTMSMQTVHGTRGNGLYFDGRVQVIDLRRRNQR